MYLILHKNISILILIGLMTMASCGKQSDIAVHNREINIRANLNFMRTLKNNEVNVGLRVCYALKTKRLKYKSYLDGHVFNLKSYKTNCAGAKSVHNFQSLLKVSSSKSMTYETTYQDHHISDVPTDQNLPMSVICSQLFNGEVPENTIQLNSKERIQFEFTNEGETDYINMHLGVLDTENTSLGGYKTTGVKVFGLKTFPATPELIGVVVNYYYATPCTDQNNQKIISIELDSRASAQ